ncbi:Ycf1 [Salix suchowensis]|nr:Ycf1 [Salix suchowensis]
MEFNYQKQNFLKTEIFYNYKIDKSKLFDMSGGIPVNKHLREDDIIDTEKSSHRKYLDWRILPFCLRKKSEDQVDLESVLANQEKDVEEDYARSDRKERRKKKQYKSNTEAELDFLLKRIDEKGNIDYRINPSVGKK